MGGLVLLGLCLGISYVYDMVIFLCDFCGFCVYFVSTCVSTLGELRLSETGKKRFFATEISTKLGVRCQCD